MTRNLILAAVATLLISVPVVSAVTPAAQQESYSIDPARSSLKWTGKKLTGSHFGTVAIKGGTALVAGAMPVRGEVAVDMSSIAVLDIEDPTYNKKLQKHLKSEDFFSAAQFPASTLTIDRVEPIAEAKAGESNYNLQGTLTIVGISRPIAFPAKIEVTKDAMHGTAKLELDRTNWNIRYGSGKFFENLGDKLIYDTFEIDVELFANKQAPAA